MARKQSPTTTAGGDVRVSASHQADHGVSLDAQAGKIRAYAQLYDIELVDVIVDAGTSANLTDYLTAQQEDAHDGDEE